jgi:hypothetical protein
VWQVAKEQDWLISNRTCWRLRLSKLMNSCTHRAKLDEQDKFPQERTCLCPYQGETSTQTGKSIY